MFIPPTVVPCFAITSPFVVRRYVYNSPCTRLRPAPVRDLDMSRPPSARLVPLPTGTNMEVLDVPDPPHQHTARPTLVFVHGSFHAAWAYQFFQPYLAAAGFQTNAMSMRGAGCSEQEQTTPTTVGQHVDDLCALLDVLPDERFVLVAHSLGGFVVQKLAQSIVDPSR